MADNNGHQRTDRRNPQAESIRVGDRSRLQDILSGELVYMDGLYPAYLSLQALSQCSLERNLSHLLTLVMGLL